MLHNEIIRLTFWLAVSHFDDFIILNFHSQDFLQKCFVIFLLNKYYKELFIWIPGYRSNTEQTVLLENVFCERCHFCIINRIMQR